MRRHSSSPFWCLCQKLSLSLLTLIKLCYTKALESPGLVPGPEVKSSLEITNPTPFTISYQQLVRVSGVFYSLSPGSLALTGHKHLKSWSSDFTSACTILFLQSFIYLFLVMLSLHWCLSFSLVAESGKLLSSCRVQACHCSGLSHCGAWALGCSGFSCCSSRVLEHRFNSCGAWV